MANKVQYGLRNVYYAPITYGTSGAEVYGTPVAIPGAVNLALSAEGDKVTYNADDKVYFTKASNKGYTGTLEVALLPDSFKTAILGEVTGADGVLYEHSDANLNPFALLFEVQGDDAAHRVAMYSCTVTRPQVHSATVGDSIEPQSDTLDITAIPASNGYVKAVCAYSTSEPYTTWFTSVHTYTA